MLIDTLDQKKTQCLPPCAEISDKNGSKRLEKLNSILQKSSPLKPWILRTHSNKVCILDRIHNLLGLTSHIFDMHILPTNQHPG